MVAITNVLAEGGPCTMVTVEERGKLRPLHEIELEVLRFALQHRNGSMAKTARALGIGRSTLYRKLKLLPAHSKGDK